jgi:hypothetical protein
MRTRSRNNVLRGALEAARSDVPPPADIARFRRALGAQSAMVGAAAIGSAEAAAATAASGPSGASGSSITGALGSVTSAKTAPVAALGALGKTTTVLTLGSVSKVIMVAVVGAGGLGLASTAYISRDAEWADGQAAEPQAQTQTQPTISASPRAEPGTEKPKNQSGLSAPRSFERRKTAEPRDEQRQPPRAPAARSDEPLTNSSPRATTPSHAEVQPSASGSADSSMEAKKSEAEREAALIESARRLLGQDPAGALTLLGQHAKEFPRGLLGVERRVLVIETLYRLGRTGEAKTALLAFQRDYPASVYNRRLDSVLEKGQP